jgi:hypothetical protein
MRRVRKLPACRQITCATGVEPEGDHNFANYLKARTTTLGLVMERRTINTRTATSITTPALSSRLPPTLLLIAPLSIFAFISEQNSVKRAAKRPSLRFHLQKKITSRAQSESLAGFSCCALPLACGLLHLRPELLLGRFPDKCY